MQDLWISIGRHRREKNWKNVQYTWPQFVERLQVCQYTGETVKEYREMDPDQQASIKDVGGFVGGTITGGRRKKGAVTSRSLITLDLDKAPVDFWDDVTLYYNFTMLVYSTHKHTPESPRLRLIIPLAEDVLTDQYEAIARYIAGRLGIEYFDPTTFQSERLMYWPSMPKDGQYLFEVQGGPLLDPVKALRWYKDWRDVSQWPTHPGETRRLREGLAAAADPLEKPGIVGAFCRTYTIGDAIAVYLADVYAVTALDDRYTYTGGSTAAGLVVYDDKFAYSHHGTDPAGGVLCNAFDLVRLHKYGHLDDRVKEDTPINKRPSYTCMADLARLDSGVNLDLVKQQTARAIDVFAGDLGGGSDDWLKILETDRRGKIAGTANNLLVILRNDDGLKGRFGMDLFTVRRMALGALPWAEAGGVGGPRLWSDEDDAGLRWYLETVYGITTVNKIYDSVSMVMRENGYHPIREYLEGCAWDQVERIDTLLVDYFGAEDNGYTRAVMRKCLVAAVARVMEPGVKFDNVLVLVGPQGAGKSTFISRLAGQWYSDSFGRLDTKEAMENIQGVWIMEAGELAGLKRAEVEVVKHFFSKQYDEFRPAYGRNVVKYYRQSIFIASSNTDDFLQDQTGGRRFWPVRVGFGAPGIFKCMTAKEVKLIWAEAVEAWAADESLHLTPEIEVLARAVQTEHTEKDGWEDLIRDYLEKLLPESWATMSLYDRKSFLRGENEILPVGMVRRDMITSLEIWREFIEGSKESFTTGAGRRINIIMGKMEGWKAESNRTRIEGVRTKCFIRTE